MDLDLVLGVIVIGFVHGVLPDHGWPIAATYGLNHSRTWLYGTLGGLILGLGHLFSSVVLVLAYFWFSRFASFAEGPWLRYVAGTMLILLGIHEYRHGGHGHSHGHGHGHDHGHEHGHDHDHQQEHTHKHGNGHGSEHEHDHNTAEINEDEVSNSGLLSNLRTKLFGGDGDGHRHLDESDADRGLFALGATALLLGFAHEEPIQILAICVGTAYCLELMLLYSLAVIIAILVPTLLLIAGYERHRETVERYTPYLPLVTAVVLVGMGLAFIGGIF
ncbi:ABC transporter permease [Natrialba sp. SSL1]|uniref:ABC transporter permease n=1 Tax=Natrialba sp. SSL1 TaxID=1869245 RepID=UPI0008F8CF5B|nr:ABC transporter permease [Natrialba sp. SSL1]OIB58807.1 ABC transporter permease [Natrialba sp. SSL1]